jgi:carboxypeptidase-like protein
MISYISKNTPFSLTIILLCLPLVLFSQEKQLLSKDISGKITYLNAPLENVNIIILDTKTGTKTDAQGYYTLKADVGDIIKYSYVGFSTVSIVVEDITSILNIEMIQKDNELDEVVVKARKKPSKVSELEKKLDVNLRTPFGTFNPKKSGFSIPYIAGKDLNSAALSLADALNGKRAGIRIINGTLMIRNRPATYIMDGIRSEFMSSINIADIEDVYVVKHKALVIIRTKMSFDVREEKRKQNIEQYKNQNYYKEDAVTVNKETLPTSTAPAIQKTYITIKDISGTITNLNVPLENVNIIILDTKTGTKTDAQGYYTLKADVGDIIKYSHVGFNTVSIIIEDITDVLNIEMLKRTNELDEVVVSAKSKPNKTLEKWEKKNKKFSTSMGEFNPEKAGYSLSYVDGEDINPMYTTLTQALLGRLAGYSTYLGYPFLRSPKPKTPEIPPKGHAVWDVDGVVFEEEPPIDINNIKDIYVIRSLAGTNRYGSTGRNGVIVVRTKYGSFENTKAKKKEITEQYTNKNYYANDALAINTETLFTNSYSSTLESFNNTQKALEYYNQTLKNQIQDYSTHIDIAQNFITYYNNTNVAVLILDDLANKHNNNPEILKAIAYQFQILGLKKEAIKLYQSIFKLRPKYAQSYRDLANAYNKNELFKKAWRMYMSYLYQGNDVSGEGIGNILYNEMEWLYFNRKNQTAIKERFVPKNETVLDFRNDVRFVFEWNTSEAEFNLEFVNQEKRIYVFEHSLAANQELITDEKEKGYSSKEFIIEDIGEGEWLVNIAYKGNKKPEPTYFKVTKYYNWGKPSQKQEITVYKFQNQRQKIQLLKLNKQVLVASN